MALDRGRSDRRRRHEQLRQQMENERSSFIPHWRDLGDFILPRRPRFFVTDSNRGDRRSRNIIDSTATLAVRTLRSGMMAGVTSPARPWFRLTTPDQSLAEEADVKLWLHVVTRRMSAVFLRSNLYRSLPVVYGDLGVFGTAAMVVEEDTDRVLHTMPVPVGSYMIAADRDGRVNVFLREFQMTVRQVVDEFVRRPGGEMDWSVASDHVREQWEEDRPEAWVEVVHLVEPNLERDSGPPGVRGRRYASYYYERGAHGGRYYSDSGDYDRYLREAGYDLFPVLAPRWETTGEDVYGTDCPGMTALGDVRQLQVGERRGLQGLDKQINPPMNAPTHARAAKLSLLPGDTNFLDVRDGQQGFRPVHETNFRLEALEAKQAQVRQRISRAFYEDLFLMLANTDRREITAREIEERHEEKLLALGPVLEQLNGDLLDPLIDIAFEYMVRQGLVPEAPEALQGVPLRVEYVSVMAQAQKLAGLAGLERFAQFAGQVAAADPQAMDKVDRDQLIDVYAETVGVPPDVVVPDEAVAEIRAARAAAQEQAARMAAIQQGAAAAKDLAAADMGKDSALSRLAQAAQAGQLTPGVPGAEEPA